MNCYSCNTPLIWGGDEDADEDDFHNEGSQYTIMTNLSCPKCNSTVIVYHA